MKIASKLASIALTSGLVVAGFGAVGGMTGVASAAPGGPVVANVGVTPGITMTGLTPSFTLSGSPGSDVELLSAVSYNVETNNVGYGVTVQSRTATMTPAVPNGDSIAIGLLTARDGTPAVPAAYVGLMAGTARTVHSQGGRSATGGDNLTTDYLIHIPVVAVATYTATLDYIATAA
ncbi:MAG: hypothetical protein QOF30_2431 [Acidimicrobiaceae bacterium]|jgi:hypothetical protein|nr:hypothetical protein [Acidimicrobiaceae bacterium]